MLLLWEYVLPAGGVWTVTEVGQFKSDSESQVMPESFLSHQNKKLYLKTSAMTGYYIQKQVSKKACVPCTR